MLPTGQSQERTMKISGVHRGLSRDIYKTTDALSIEIVKLACDRFRVK